MVIVPKLILSSPVVTALQSSTPYQQDCYLLEVPVGGMGSKLPMASGIYKYSRITTNTSTYARRMNRLSNHIFGEVVRPSAASSVRVVKMFSEKPLDLRPEITDYYPRHVETYDLMQLLRRYGLFRDEHQDFKEEMIRLRALRGKVKTKKGEGKRSKQE